MTLFTPELKDKCLDVIEKISSMSMCSLFLDPVDPVNDGAPDYYQIIKNPQCFSQIREKLESDKYKYTYEWKNDVNLIFSNAILYNGETSVIGEIAAAMKETFYRLSKGIVTYTEREWIARVNHYNAKINKLMLNPPKLNKIKLPQADIEFPLSEKEMKALSTATLSLTSRNDTFQMIELLTSFGMNIELDKPELKIDLNQIPSQAVYALQKYVKERFQSLGLAYPK